MMKGATHLAGGLLAGALAGNNPAGLAAAVIAALVPDWIELNVPGLNVLVKGANGHRGLSHWLLTALVVWGLVRLTSPEMAIYALAGWLSHIALDTLSNGVPALWPWSKRITLARIKTGSELDTWVGAALLVLAGVILLQKWL